MEITLPKEALDGLPAPDDKGLVRVTATLELMPGGKISLVEINDSPVGEPEGDKESSDEDVKNYQAPDLSDAPAGLY